MAETTRTTNIYKYNFPTIYFRYPRETLKITDQNNLKSYVSHWISATLLPLIRFKHQNSFHAMFFIFMLQSNTIPLCSTLTILRYK